MQNVHTISAQSIQRQADKLYNIAHNTTNKHYIMMTS